MKEVPLTDMIVSTTFWEKTHLSIEPSILRSLLAGNATVMYCDRDTDEVLKFTARRIAEICEYDEKQKSYVFPISA